MLYARWQPNVNTVSFVDESGNVIEKQQVRSGDTATEIENGSDAGYVFTDWFADETGSTAYDFSQPITSDTTIYGKWTTQSYVVTFDSNGGSAVIPQSQQVAYEGFAQKPDDPIWEGHAFLGWYEDLSNEMTPDEFAEMKAQMLDDLKSEEIDPETAEELNQALQAINQRVSVFDGKVMMAYNPEIDPVYSDMTVQAQWQGGSITTEVILGDGVPHIDVLNFDEAARSMVTAEEMAQEVVVRLSVAKIDPADALPADKATLQAKLGELEAKDHMWLDISLVKVTGGVETKIETVDMPLELSMEIPEDLRADSRTFYLLRAHEGEADVVSTGTGTTLVGSTDRFSTYVLASKDAPQKAATKGSSAKTGDVLGAWIVPMLGFTCLLAVGALIFLAMKRRRA